MSDAAILPGASANFEFLSSTMQMKMKLLHEEDLLNFLSDLPSIAISTDRVDPERLAAPQRWQVKDLQRFMIVFGLISTVFDLLTFLLLHRWFHEIGRASCRERV
mgnify:CR=1 FL=1